MVEVMVAVWCKLTYGEYGFSPMGSWSYSRDSV